MKFSFIIPVYNVQDYIDRCLHSIYDQNLDPSVFEVIAVNDGSTDNSLNILHSYSEIYPNLTVFSQKNQGVSLARNLGIRKAQGEFILFLDSDDCFTPKSLPKLFNYVSQSFKFDLLVLNSISYGSPETKFYDWTQCIDSNLTYSGSELFDKYEYFRGSSCGVCYRREFLLSNQIFFPEQISNSEDTIFWGLCQTYAEHVSFLNLDLYRVFLRDGSASRKSASINTMKTYLQALLSCQELLKSRKIQFPKTDILNYVKYVLYSILTYQLINSRCSFNYIRKHPAIRITRPIRLKHHFSFSRQLKILILNRSYTIFYIFVKLKSFFN